jgi:heme exporter protein C
VMKMDGPSIHASMLWPLLLMALAFKAYYVVVVLMRIRAELAARRVRAVRIALATAAS